VQALLLGPPLFISLFAMTLLWVVIALVRFLPPDPSISVVWLKKHDSILSLALARTELCVFFFSREIPVAGKLVVGGGGC
jgi:hypothetical protein